jgi:hypothetical protein
MFTSRCLNYAIEKEDGDEALSRDLKNKAFWDKLKSIFQQTIEMVNELAREMEMGIDLKALDTESPSSDISHQMGMSKNHELFQSAYYYSEITDKWFEAEYLLFEQRQNELNTVLKLGIGGEEPYTEAAEISDAVKVIRWYQHQIHVKLMRALTQVELVDTMKDDDMQRDSDGFALVALFAIDRSIGAWGRLQEYFQEKTNSILDILLHLDRLRRKIEQVFPDARNFKRPGFDDLN